MPDAGTYRFHPYHGLQLEHGLYAPFIIDAPGDSVELLFQAANPCQWMLHCHNAHHLDAGMATILSYRGS